MISFYELKCLILETFYENILEEKYTIKQSVQKCLIEFYDEINLKNKDSLIIYSSVFEKLAKYEPHSLLLFKKHLNIMNDLFNDKEILKNIKNEEFKIIKSDIEYVKSKCF